MVQAINASFPNVQDVEQWDACERWLPHAQVCADWIEHGPIMELEAASLLNQAGLYLDARARYSEAEPLFKRVLVIYEQQLGVDHLNTAQSHNNLAVLYQNQGKYAEAEILYQRALSIREQQLGGDHPYTAVSLNNLAALYYQQGKYAEAEPLYQRALAIREQQMEADYSETAQSLNNLAALYKGCRGRAIVPLRPCGTEDSASRMRHHWSNVIKAASYLYSQEYRDTFIRKERGDKSMM